MKRVQKRQLNAQDYQNNSQKFPKIDVWPEHACPKILIPQFLFSVTLCMPWVRCGRLATARQLARLMGAERLYDEFQDWFGEGPAPVAKLAEVFAAAGLAVSPEQLAARRRPLRAHFVPPGTSLRLRVIQENVSLCVSVWYLPWCILACTPFFVTIV